MEEDGGVGGTGVEGSVEIRILIAISTVGCEVQIYKTSLCLRRDAISVGHPENKFPWRQFREIPVI